MKQRLDQMIVMRGLAPTRSQARDLIRRGCVRVAGVTATKPARELAPDAIVEVADGAQPYVSRGGLKLAAALDAFGFEARGVIALDVGASTGGFTHALLEAGAARVHAVDVGRGQLHPRLAADRRVRSLEGFDARQLAVVDVPDPIGAVVADVSFISLTQVLPAAMSLARPDAWLAALIKPQFEAGREALAKNGVVKTELDRAVAVEKVRGWLSAQPGWSISGIIPSPITGGSGNLEFLIGARRDR